MHKVEKCLDGPLLPKKTLRGKAEPRLVKEKNTPVVLEGLAAVINYVICSVPVPGSTFYVHACHPRGALPAPGLAGCPVGRGE